MIGQYLIDLVDEAGYLVGDLAAGRRKARRAARRGRGGARDRCRASIRRACARAISPSASRSSSRSATASIPRCRRWSAGSICSPSAISPRCAAICGVGDDDLTEMIAEIRSAQSEARPRLRLDHGAADRARRVRAARPRRRLRRSSSTPTRCPKVLVNQRYHAELSKTAANDNAKTYLAGESAVGDLADPRARSARQDHPQGGDRDRQTAGRVLRARRAASAPAQSQDRRRRHRHARIDGVARHRQQVHRDQPRHFRTEVFLHLRDRRRPTAARRIRPKRCAIASSR